MARLGVPVGGRVRTLRAGGIIPATPYKSDSSLHPCWTAFLSILREWFLLVPDMQAIEALLG